MNTNVQYPTGGAKYITPGELEQLIKSTDFSKLYMTVSVETMTFRKFDVSRLDMALVANIFNSLAYIDQKNDGDDLDILLNRVSYEKLPKTERPKQATIQDHDGKTLSTHSLGKIEQMTAKQETLYRTMIFLAFMMAQKQKEKNEPTIESSSKDLPLPTPKPPKKDDANPVKQARRDAQQSAKNDHAKALQQQQLRDQEFHNRLRHVVQKDQQANTQRRRAVDAQENRKARLET